MVFMNSILSNQPTHLMAVLHVPSLCSSVSKFLDTKVDYPGDINELMSLVCILVSSDDCTRVKHILNMLNNLDENPEYNGITEYHLSKINDIENIVADLAVEIQTQLACIDQRLTQHPTISILRILNDYQHVYVSITLT